MLLIVLLLYTTLLLLLLLLLLPRGLLLQLGCWAQPLVADWACRLWATRAASAANICIGANGMARQAVCERLLWLKLTGRHAVAHAHKA